MVIDFCWRRVLSRSTHLLTGLILLVVRLSPAAELRLEVREESGVLIPARVHLHDRSNAPVKAPGLPFWHDHFVCTGAVTLALAPGEYRWQIERGPEWSRSTGTVTLAQTDARTIRSSLRRIADLAGEGWWSGETHVHRDLRETELLLRAEDLPVGHVITWWNKVNPWINRPLPNPPLLSPGARGFQHPLGGEDERDGGALLYLDLNKPLEITAGTRHFPSSLTYARSARERGAKWIDAEKPFWWDFPMWVAHGAVDTVGLANNHMQRGGMLDNEAWGRARDRGTFPGPRGNGFYTQFLYYQLLNTGVRLPPSAGSASGVLPNPVGYNRVYVHLDGAFEATKWRDGLLAGRSFVSNGPLLRCRANDRWPGEIFRGPDPLELEIEGRLDSREPIAGVELVHNGRVEKINLPHRFTVRESGWFLVRAVADVTNTFRFASTAPWHVEIGGRPMKPRVEAVQFFLDWCRERRQRLASLNGISAAQQAELLQPWREAESFWAGKLGAAREDKR